uniref:Phosphate/phosphoenolpyruvate translocator n=1 Tax=Zygophyllum xanthoxylum TaxID=90549 RepID=A0A5C0C686_9ROSI|nr:phosphate/phosphoenolpyruvate translocator [Zygophyllum xanthoxylum]
MQRSALAASAPTAVFKPSKWYSYPRIIPTLWTSSLKQRDLCYAHRISCRKDLHRNYLSGSNASNPDSFLVRSKEYRDNFVVRATAVPENLEGNVEPAKLGRTLQLALMFGAWYLLNIYFNIYNKQVLKVFHFPATVTAIQFGCATTSISLMWAFNLYKRPKLTRSQVVSFIGIELSICIVSFVSIVVHVLLEQYSKFQFLAVLPLAIAHTVGNILTNVSLGRVNVSFTHTIKAMEPFFTVVLASLFLGEVLFFPALGKFIEEKCKKLFQNH